MFNLDHSGAAAIHDASSRRFSPTHLCMAMSRATNGRNVSRERAHTRRCRMTPSHDSIWQAAGRPGLAKLCSATAREDFDLSVKQAVEFARTQPVLQAFAPAPRSEGRSSLPC